MSAIRSMKLSTTLLVSTLLLGLLGCGGQRAPQSEYKFRVISESDPGVPISGVTLSRDSLPVATTSNAGVADFTVRGAEGERIALVAICPDGYSADEQATTAVLRSYAGGRVPELLVRCTAERSLLAVVVRLENGPNLVVQHRSRTLAVTDSQGVAHVLLEGTPGDTLELSLNTESRPDIRPSNPSARFTLAGASDVALFEQTFLVEKTKKKFRYARPKNDESSRPVRLR